MQELNCLLVADRVHGAAWQLPRAQAMARYSCCGRALRRKSKDGYLRQR